MTPPPEQYVLDASPRLVRGAASIRLGRLPLPQTVLPAADTAALVLLAVFLHILFGPLDLGSIVLLAVTLLLGIRGWRGHEVNLSALEDLGTLTKQVVVAYATASAVTVLAGYPADVRTLFAGAAALPFLFLGRIAARSAQRATARNGRLTRALIVGTGETARTIAASLSGNTDYGLELIGAVGNGTSAMKRRLRARVLGTIDDMVDIVSARRIQTVIIAFDSSNDRGTVAAVRTLLSQDVDVWVVPRFFEVGALTSAQHIGALPIVRLRPATQKRLGWRFKRAVDIAFASVGLAFSAPLFLIASIAVKLDSRGPVFFRQARIGMDGKPVSILKFRSMAVSSALTEQTEWEPPADCITRVGWILRQTGIDELPQLLNVLRGDLTLVGPRPERPVFVKMFDEMYEGYSERHRVPAGITGWAQVHGLRGDTSIEDRARFDNHYIENWTFATDLKIMLLTFRTLLKRYRLADNPADDKDEETRDLADVS